ncbi:Polycomb protein suz12 [Phytophthora pseudosyringae]|uniref:Polycomb protein suz12 n=1 Tax=Phytophthora pseudosyringae TaxID=221518 RepID=A0A8T1WDK4_9STRA|nr:Polycomb protein suz12 [Phytophthora pseudosyringae]
MADTKRKRDESYERKLPLTKERRTKVRQEHMEEEFAETYHGLTALYKLLEVQHLQSPLFLPRTLSYRLDPAWQQKEQKKEVKGEKGQKQQQQQQVKTALAGAAMMDFKIGMTPDTMESFKSQKQQPGVLISLFKADGKKFDDNQFTLLATCLIPVPCSKDLTLPKEFLHLNADICVVAFQVVEISDVGETIAAQSAFKFASPSVATTVRGKDLLSTCANGRKPLFGNLLRLNVARRRGGYVTIELPAIASSVHGGVKCEFRIMWQALPNTKKMQRLASICGTKLKIEGEIQQNDETFKLAVPKRDVTSAAGKPCAGVWFHYLYHSMLRRMSEKRSEYSCAWCNMFAGSLRGLVAHLVSSHDRFRFQATVGHDNIPHVYVMVMQEHQPRKGSSGRRSVLSELEMFPNEEPSRFEHHFTHMSGKKYGPYGSQAVEAVEGLMQEFDEMDELSQEQPQEFYAPLLQRQYFHSRTGAVVLDHEKNYDSDDDVDETWITKQSERLLDEFEDVSLEEKEFMKKWNRHVKEFKILADFMVASSCRMFARSHGKWLLDHGLRHNFLLHLLNLWDNSLLNSRAIIDCMLIVDQNQESEAPENGAEVETQAKGESLEAKVDEAPVTTAQ